MGPSGVGLVGAQRWQGGWGPGVVGTFELLLCSKRNAVSVVVTCEVVGTLNHYNIVKIID